MTNDWLKKLLSDQRPQRLPEALLHVKGDPKWEGNALHVILKNEDGISAKVGHIYPGAEWVVSEREKHDTVHIKLFAQDARHYINLFNNRYPSRALPDQLLETRTSQPLTWNSLIPGAAKREAIASLVAVAAGWVSSPSNPNKIVVTLKAEGADAALDKLTGAFKPKLVRKEEPREFDSDQRPKVILSGDARDRFIANATMAERKNLNFPC